MSAVARCRSCNASIRWTVTTGGKAMPLDYVASPDGNVVRTGNKVTDMFGREVDEVRVLGKDEPRPAGVSLFRSHHSSCPQAGRWRR